MSKRERNFELRCPECGSEHIGFSFSVFDAFKKRGSKLVRKRNVEFVPADWVCFDCKYKWSAHAYICEIRFNRRMSRCAFDLRTRFNDVRLEMRDSL